MGETTTIVHEFVVQYSFPKMKDEEEEHWSDEGGCNYTFDPEDPDNTDLAKAAAVAYAKYMDHCEKDEDFKVVHRVVHRISSDLVVE